MIEMVYGCRISRCTCVLLLSDLCASGGHGALCPCRAAGNCEIVVGEMASQPRPPLPLREYVVPPAPHVGAQVWLLCEGCIRNLSPSWESSYTSVV